MNWMIWYAIGIACGCAIGYEELEKKIKSRIQDLYREKNIKCIDENGNELPCESLSAFLFPKRFNKY